MSLYVILYLSASLTADFTKHYNWRISYQLLAISHQLSSIHYFYQREL